MILIGSKTTASTTTSGATLTFQHTVIDGPNRLLIVRVGVHSEVGAAQVVSSVTYGSINMFLAGRAGSGTGPGAEIWYLIGPAVGTNNITITLAAAEDRISAEARNFYGVHQSTPIGTPVSYFNSGDDTPNIVVNTAVGNLVIDALASYDTPTIATATPGTDQELSSDIVTTATGETRLTTSHATAVGTAQLMTWETSGVPIVALVGVALKQATTISGLDSAGISMDEAASTGLVPPTGPQTFSGVTGSVSVEIPSLMVKATASKITSSEILKQNIAGGDATDPQATQLSGKATFIRPVDPQFPEFRSIRFENATVQSIAAQMGHFADREEGRAWYSAVWEGRHFHFRPIDTKEIRWRISKTEMGEQGVRLERILTNYWSHVQAFYKDGNDIWQSIPPKSDPLFRDSVPFPRETFLDTGNAPITTVARDAFFEDFKIPQPNTEFTLTGQIYNAMGVPEPLWRVRAGDVFQITDLLADIGPAADPLRTFVIKETGYNYADNSLTITPAVAMGKLETLLARVQQFGKT